MEDELDNAVGELIEAHDFIMEIARLPTEEMVEKVEERDPSFIEHIEAMEQPPKTAEEFWEGFSIWTVSGLANKYHHIWHEVCTAFFGSEAHKRRVQNSRFETVIWSDIDQILKASGF